MTVISKRVYYLSKTSLKSCVQAGGGGGCVRGGGETFVEVDNRKTRDKMNFYFSDRGRSMVNADRYDNPTTRPSKHRGSCTLHGDLPSPG